MQTRGRKGKALKFSASCLPGRIGNAGHYLLILVYVVDIALLRWIHRSHRYHRNAPESAETINHHSRKTFE